MPSRGVRYIVLIIRMTASFTLIVVWIIRGPASNGGALSLKELGAGWLWEGANGVLQRTGYCLAGHHGHSLALRCSRPPCHWQHAFFTNEYPYLYSLAISIIHVNSSRLQFPLDYYGVNVYRGKLLNILPLFAHASLLRS